MSGGLLDYLGDPEKMAEIEQANAKRDYIIGRLCEQTGATRQEMRDSLWCFEFITTSEGQTLH